MALWTWWQRDSLPELSPIPRLRVETERRVDVLALLTALEPSEVDARLAAGHRAYVARLDGEAVAYGWVADLAASIGELNLSFSVAPGDRYLWDFVTLPAWRGRGLYPRLLQGIIRAERPGGRRFWVINAPENAASGAGIAKAGFRPVGELSFQADRQVAALPDGDLNRARMGAALLGVPLLEAVRDGRVLSPCWRCVVTAKHDPASDAACWPYRDGVAVGCGCA